MAEVIGRADYEIGADQTPLVQGLSEAASKIAAWGTRIGKGTGTTGDAFYQLGQKIGKAFNSVSTGAEEAERAQGKFMAATGASRDEAKLFISSMDGIAGQAGTVGKSFDEIAATGTEVARQFQLTGKAGADMTEQFLEFSRVTGQDAVGAVERLDGMLDAFHLPAERAAGLMDQFTLSNQKFGTDVGPETLDQLTKMAPALQALGGNLDDGIGLLNLFENAGLDSAGAVKGLNAAILKIPPGETLDEVFTRLAAIEDPAKRAAAAAELFGTKAGAGIANALTPGMQGLDDFRVSAEEAAGATEQAADDMLTFGDRIKGWSDKALAGAREIGQQFGPLLTGVGALKDLVGPLTSGLGSVLNVVKGKILPQAAVVGAEIGLAEGEATATASTGPGVLRSFLTKFGLLTPAKVGAAVVAGEVVGAAEGEAIAVGSTSGSVLSSMQTKIAGLGNALGPSGSIAGRAVGIAMGIAMVVGIAYAAEEASNNEEVRNAAQSTARNFFGGFGDESEGLLKGTVVDSLTDGFHGLWNSLAQISIPLGDDAGQWTGEGYVKGVDKSIREHQPLVVDAVTGVGASLVPAFASGVDSSGYDSYMRFLGTRVPEGIAAGVVSNTPVLDAALAEMAAKALKDAHDKVIADATAIGEGVPGSIGDAIYSHATEALDGMAHLQDVLKNGLTSDEIANKAIGKEYITDLEKGFESEIPGAKETAQQVAVAAIAAIADANLPGKKGVKGTEAIGIMYVDLLRSGLSQEEARAALAGEHVSSEVIDGLEAKYPAFVTTGETAADKVHTGFTSRPWQTWGSGSAGEWVSGFANGIDRKTWFIENKLDKLFKNNSPPRVAPNIDKHGFKTGQLWAESLGKGAGSVLSGLAPSMPTLAPALALGPGVGLGPGTRPILTAGMPSAAGGRSISIAGVTINISGVAGDPAAIGAGAADAFIWQLEHALGSTDSG